MNRIPLPAVTANIASHLAKQLQIQLAWQCSAWGLQDAEKAQVIGNFIRLITLENAECLKGNGNDK